jgi:uncharacterized protein DUF4332
MSRIERTRTAIRTEAADPASKTARSGPAEAGIPAAPRDRDEFRAARSEDRGRRARPTADLVAIREARASKRKLLVDEALVAKYTERVRSEHAQNADHRRELQLAAAAAQMPADAYTAVLARGDQMLTGFVGGLRGKRFGSEEELRVRIDGEVGRVQFREQIDPVRFLAGPEGIESVGEMALPKAQVELLRDAGLRTNYDVLQRCGTPDERIALRDELKLARKDFQRLVTHADLTRITDLGGFYADTLRRTGIESVAELATFTPEKLLRELTENLQARNLESHAPEPERCENWIRQAQHLPRIVHSASTLSLHLAERAALEYWEEQQGSPVRYFPNKERWYEAYQKDGGIPGPWIWRQQHDTNEVYFQCGADDLNHVDIASDRKTGEVTVVGEH